MYVWNDDETFPSSYFQDSLFVFSFWPFDYDVSQSRSLWAYLIWASGCIDDSIFSKSVVFRHYFFKYFSFCIFSPWRLLLCVCWVLNGIPQIFDALFIFLSFCSSDWITTTDQFSSSLILSSASSNQFLSSSS